MRYNEVRNAIKAYELPDVLDPYSIDDLLKVHETIQLGLIDDAGRFRAAGVGIASSDEIIHYAPPADRVPYLIKELFEWLKNSDEHPLIKSSVFHYEFEFIHPFSDGNGRTGRLWQTLLLSKWREIFKYMPVENLVHKYRKEYYQAIATSGSMQGCTPFIEFILKAIHETITTQETAQETTQEKITHQIRQNPKITRSELAQIIGMSSDGIKYHLQKLIKAGFIERKGSTRYG